MRFYNSLPAITLAGALLLSSTYVEAMREELEDSTFHHTTLSQGEVASHVTEAQDMSSVSQNILTIILRHASTGIQDDINLIFRRVCKKWKNVTDKNTNDILLRFLDKWFSLKDEERIYCVKRFKLADGRVCRHPAMFNLEEVYIKRMTPPRFQARTSSVYRSLSLRPEF